MRKTGEICRSYAFSVNSKSLWVFLEHSPAPHDRRGACSRGRTPAPNGRAPIAAPRCRLLSHLGSTQSSPPENAHDFLTLLGQTIFETKLDIEGRHHDPGGQLPGHSGYRRFARVEQTLFLDRAVRGGGAPHFPGSFQFTFG